MPDFLEIAKLRSHNFSQRAIAKSLSLSRNTVSNIFTTMDLNHLNYEKMKQMPPEQLQPLFSTKKELSSTAYTEPDYPTGETRCHNEAAVGGIHRQVFSQSSGSLSSHTV